MSSALPEGYEPASALSARDAGEALDRSLRTTDDAMRFADALARSLGPLCYDDPWVKPGGSRRLFSRDPDNPSWILAKPLLELVLDVPAPPPWTQQILLPDGTTMPFPGHDRPRPQPSGPNQRSAELRLFEGERYAQWAYDEQGLTRERMRGRGDLSGDGAAPLARDVRLLERSPQLPLSIFTRPDLDPDGHSPDELARRVVETDTRADNRIRVRLPQPIPGGPALAARRAVWELRKASFEGRFSYPAAGWVVMDGYLAEVVATGATLESAFAEWERAMKLINPEPRDNRTTPEERARFERELEEEAERAVEAGEKLNEPTHERTPDGKGLVSKSRMMIRFEPPVQMPWPARRPENAPAVAIHLAEPPAIPAPWRENGFTRVVRTCDEEGRFANLFLATPDGEGWLLVGEEAARQLDPRGLVARLRQVDEEATRKDLETWGAFEDRPFADSRKAAKWITAEFSVLAPDGRSTGPLRRGSIGWSAEASPPSLEPSARWGVFWQRPSGT